MILLYLIIIKHQDTIYETTSNTTDSFWTASAKYSTFAVSGSGLNNDEGLFVAVDSGYQKSDLGGTFPFIASYFLNVDNSDTMFQRVPFGWAKLHDSRGKFHYIFKSTMIYFHTVGERDRDTPNPFISRTCMMDTGNSRNKYGAVKYRSYVDTQFRFSQLLISIL